MIFGPFLIETGLRLAMSGRVVIETENGVRIVRTVVYTGVDGL